MHPLGPPELPPRPNPFKGADVLAILLENRWQQSQPTPEQLAWCDQAGSLLGQFAVDRPALAEILRLIFEFNAAQILQLPDSHAVLARHGARDVIRHLALHLLEPGQLDSDRFKALINQLKEELHVGSRDLFHPIRLVLTGRSGQGELDRVILLLDQAASLPFAVSVKPTKTRVLEFCAAME
jgi:glutamyl/glutaminyl-tRNA synthetase